MARPKKRTTTATQKIAATESAPLLVENVPKQTRTTVLPRRLKLGRYRSFRMQKSIKPVQRPIVSAPRLFVRALRILKLHWKLFAGILVVYLVLNLIFVGGLSGTSNLSSLKSVLDQVFTGHFSKLSTGLTLFTVLIGSVGSGGTTAVAGAYQTILLLLISVILIWALRQVYAKHQVGVRDAFYHGVYPLVPFILVLLVVSIELVPLVIGATIYNLVVGGGIAINLLEKGLTGFLFLSLAVMSIYMICSSIFALYIVTLPNMRPMQALRSAREIVQFRRWIVLRKLLFLPLALIVVSAVIMVPILLYMTPAAATVFFGLTIITVAVVHSYMYALYRELL